MKKAVKAIIAEPGLIPPLPAREHIRYGEYNSISDEALFAWFAGKQKTWSQPPYGYTIAAISEDKIVGWIRCDTDHFDSETFGFPCMHMTTPYLFTECDEDADAIVKTMLKELERELKKEYGKVHLRCGIGNAPLKNSYILNSAIAAGFVYIQTLLTFVLPEGRDMPAPPEQYGDLIIRPSVADDAKHVANIAGSSFMYSRYHMDPFLDNSKADNLLYNSARNSIIEGFADTVFVAELKGKIVGYYSGKKLQEPASGKVAGEAVISAVDSDSRGLGVFSKLDDHLLYWFCKNVDFAEMGTYLINRPVIRTWVGKQLPIIRGTHQLSKLITR